MIDMNNGAKKELESDWREESTGEESVSIGEN